MPLTRFNKRNATADTMYALVDTKKGILDTALIKAARAGDRDKCVHLLKDKSTGDVSQLGRGKKTALMTAAEGGHLDIVELLINHGASLRDKDKDENTTLIYASKSGIMKMVDIV